MSPNPVATLGKAVAMFAIAGDVDEAQAKAMMARDGIVVRL